MVIVTTHTHTHTIKHAHKHPVELLYTSDQFVTAAAS